MKFIRIESFRKGILLSAIFNILAKGLLFLINLLVAYYFGSNSKTDIYFYVYTTILLIAGFFSMLNSTVVIPEAMRIRSKEGELKSKQFFNFFIALYLAVTLLIILIFSMNPLGFFITASNFNYEILKINSSLLFLAAPLIALVTLTNLLTDILISYRYFTAPMLVGIINGIISILFLIAFHSTLGIEGLLIGFIFSYTVNIVYLLLLMRRHLNWSFSLKFFLTDKRIWGNILFAQAGNITSIVSNYAPLYLLSGFNAGIITALTLAQQLVSMPTTLITTHFSTVASIKFNELYSQRNYKILSQNFIFTANFLLFILTPISGVFFLFSDEIISIIFKHGKFNQSAAEHAALFLKYLGFLVPLQSVNTLLARLFMASHKIAQSFWYQIVFNIILILTMFYMVNHFGILWYPLTLIMVYFVNVFINYPLEKYFFNFIHYARVLKHFLQILAINGVIIGAINILLTHFVFIESDVIRLSIGGAFYCSLVTVTNYWFNLNEAVTLYSKKFATIISRLLTNS